MSDERRFFTQYERKDKAVSTSSSGCGIRPIFAYQCDKDGRKHLVRIGKKDAQAEIESWRESVDIHALLSRYLDGDALAFERRQALFCDITSLPSDVHSWHDLGKNAHEFFDSLSNDVRSSFNNDYSVFLEKVLNGDVRSTDLFTSSDSNSDSQST